MLYRSNTSSTRRTVPGSEDIPFFVRVMTVKPFFPAMPVIILPEARSVSDSSKLSRIMVPGCSGWLVLRIFSGMFFSRTGDTVPSWSTCAPM